MNSVTFLPPAIRQMFPIEMVVADTIPHRAAPHSCRSGQHVWAVGFDPHCRNFALVTKRPTNGILGEPEFRLKIDFLRHTDPEQDLERIMDRLMRALSGPAANIQTLNSSG